MNLARMLNLKWLAQLTEVIRTPSSIILARAYFATTLEELMINDINARDTARVILWLANALIHLYNFGIAHRDIRPSKVLVNL